MAPVPSLDGKLRVDEDVDLRRRHADRARPHQQQHAAERRVAEIERRSIAIALVAKRPPLNGQLAEPADQRRDRDQHDGLHTELRRERHQRHGDHDGRDVEHRRRERGHEEVTERVQHAHEHGGERPPASETAP